VPASGRFARGTVLSCDHVGVLPHSRCHGLAPWSFTFVALGPKVSCCWGS